MAKITQVNAGDSGLTARNKINEALKDITDKSVGELVDVDLTSPATDGQALAWNDSAGVFAPATVNDSGIEDAPEDGGQYTRQDATWATLGSSNITLDNGVSIKTQDNENLVSYIHAVDSPDFPNALIITIGEAAAGINFDGMLFEPLVMKNDTAIQGYFADYQTITNLLSIAPDDYAIIGDDTTVTAIRALDTLTGNPVIRVGEIGLTTDYKIIHEGNVDDFVSGGTTAATAAEVVAGARNDVMLTPFNMRDINNIFLGSGAGATPTGSPGNIAIGVNAGNDSQQFECIAIGTNTGHTNQGNYALALGHTAGNTNQGDRAIALGHDAGKTSQSFAAIAIGWQAGNVTQGQRTIALGVDAGGNNQGNDAIAIGYQSGYEDQSEDAVAIGYQTGLARQGINSVAIGTNSGSYDLGNGAITIGYTAGINGTGVNTIGIGYEAAVTGQGDYALAVGSNAGKTDQSYGAVAVGYWAGNNRQGQNAIAIGENAGNVDQGQNAIAIGLDAAGSTQGAGAIAIGYQSGGTDQEAGGVSIETPNGEFTYTPSTKVWNLTNDTTDATLLVNGAEVGGGGGVDLAADYAWTGEHTFTKSTSGSDATAIGFEAGNTAQGESAVAIGDQAGYSSQAESAVAIGTGAGAATQSINAVAIGYQAGYDKQSTESVAIGDKAGHSSQGESAVAIGDNAGEENQGDYAVAIGHQAGEFGQTGYAVAIGDHAGETNQSSYGIAIGSETGQETQGSHAIAMGWQSGQTNQGLYSVAFGYSAGRTTQGSQSVAIGYEAGRAGQSQQSVAIGDIAAYADQGQEAVAIGWRAGYTGQGDGSIAIGPEAGDTGQGGSSVAIGNNAGNYAQGEGSIAIGSGAKSGDTYYGAGYVSAGTGQEAGAIALETWDGQFTYTPSTNVWNLTNTDGDAILHVNGAEVGGGGNPLDADLDLNNFNIVTDEGVDILGYTKSSAGDPLFPDVTFVEIGEAGTGINIASVLFEPLVMKNDTAVQAYDAAYVSVANVISRAADDAVIVGDGGSVMTAIRAEDETVSPVVRMGAFGSTIDYKIVHEGNVDDFVSGGALAATVSPLTPADDSNIIDASGTNYAVVTNGTNPLTIINIPNGVYTLTIKLDDSKLDTSILSILWEGGISPEGTSGVDIVTLTTYNGVEWLGSVASYY